MLELPKDSFDKTEVQIKGDQLEKSSNENDQRGWGGVLENPANVLQYCCSWTRRWWLFWETQRSCRRNINEIKRAWFVKAPEELQKILKREQEWSERETDTGSKLEEGQEALEKKTKTKGWYIWIPCLGLGIVENLTIRFDFDSSGHDSIWFGFNIA